MIRSLPLAILAVAGPSLLTAQEASDRFVHARPPVVLALPIVETAPPTVAPEREPAVAALEVAEAAQRRSSVLSTLLHTVGGAVVGGWVGYVGSQVTLSDWEKEHNSSFTSKRTAWVAGGMVVGVLGSRLIGRTSAPGRPQLEVQRPREQYAVLTREQIETSGAADVYQLVYSMRKEWLVPRGVNSWQETARGRSVDDRGSIVVVPGQPSVLVYMDEIRLGEADRMREIPINDIMEIRFIEPREAVYRYGSGHSHGVILLKTVP